MSAIIDRNRNSTNELLWDFVIVKFCFYIMYVQIVVKTILTLQ